MRRLLNRSLFLVLAGLCFGAAGWAPAAHAATLVSGDFNNDGNLDFALIPQSNRVQGVCVYLSNGDGTFQPAGCYPVGPSPIALLTGDLDNDGNLDLLALNPDRGPLASGIAVLLGNGDGTFQPIARVLFPAGPYPSAFSLADLDGDGTLDVAVLSRLGSLCSLIGQGDGRFSEPRCFSIRYANEAHTLLTADVNGDGRADFVYVTPDRICVWSQNTREPHCTPTRIRSRLATIGDFTGDGIFDMALMGDLPPFGPPTVCMYAGDGEGGFQLAGCTPVPLPTPVNITLIDVADLDGDGNLDLVLAGSGRAGGQAVALLGNGDGSFQVTRPSGVPIAPVIDGIAVADFTANGVPDLLVAGSGQVCLLSGTGTGGFVDPVCFRTG